MTLLSCASLSCCSVMAAKCERSHKVHCDNAAEYRAVKPEQEQSLLSFVGGHDVVAVLPTGFRKSLIFQLAPLVVKELAKATDNGRSRVALGRSNNFKLQQSTRLQGS